MEVDVDQLLNAIREIKNFAQVDRDSTTESLVKSAAQTRLGRPLSELALVMCVFHSPGGGELGFCETMTLPTLDAFEAHFVKRDGILRLHVPGARYLWWTKWAQNVHAEIVRGDTDTVRLATYLLASRPRHAVDYGPLAEAVKSVGKSKRKPDDGDDPDAKRTFIETSSDDPTLGPT